MIGMDWMAEEPVPMTPTRWPVKSTPVVRPVAGVIRSCPRSSPAPGRRAPARSDRQPVAMMQKRADTRSPRSVSISQRFVASSKRAAVTRVSSWMSRRRSKRSATWSMYRRISGWEAYRSVQRHSCWSSSRERVRVVHALDVAAGAGVAVPVPGAADAAARLVDPRRQAEAAQAVEHVQARRTRRRR